MEDELMELVDELVLLVAEAASEQLVAAEAGALHLTVAGLAFSYGEVASGQSNPAALLRNILGRRGER